METIDERHLTTGEIAKYCHVTPVAVLKWIKAGKLKAYSTPGGHFRVLSKDFKKFLKQYVMPIPRDLAEKENIQILIADDDTSLLKIVKKIFIKIDEKLVIHTAANGYEACVKVGHFPISIALVDLMMPSMGGIELCKILKSLCETKNIEIIVMSGFLDKPKIKELKAIGITQFLSKPFDGKQIEEKIKVVIEKNNA